MLGARAALALFASLTIAESSCCCLGWLPELPESAMASDEPEIERVAREKAETDGRNLIRTTDPEYGERSHTLARDAGVDDGGVPDAGPRRDGCFSGLGALAFDLGVAVITRGHAGNDPAAQVTFDPAACARKLVVHVVKRGAVFVVVAMVVFDRDSGEELARTGTPIELVEVDDSDYGSDEIF